MTKTFLLSVFILLLIISSQINAQTNKLSFDLNFIKPFGNNFIGENHNELGLGVGVKYNFIDISKLNIGVSENVGLIGDSDILTFNTGLSMETRILKFSPYIGLGYSFFSYSMEYVSEKSNDGPTINLGLKFHILPKLFANISYDFVKFRVKEPAVDIPYNRNIQLFNLGVGFQL